MYEFKMGPKAIKLYKENFPKMFTQLLESLNIPTADFKHTSKFHGETYLEHCEMVFRSVVDDHYSFKAVDLAILHDIAKPLTADGKGGFPFHGPKGGEIAASIGREDLRWLIHYHLTVIFPMDEAKTKLVASRFSLEDLHLMHNLILADREGSKCPEDVDPTWFKESGQKAIDQWLINREKLETIIKKKETCKYVVFKNGDSFWSGGRWSSIENAQKIEYAFIYNDDVYHYYDKHIPSSSAVNLIECLKTLFERSDVGAVDIVPCDENGDILDGTTTVKRIRSAVDVYDVDIPYNRNVEHPSSPDYQSWGAPWILAKELLEVFFSVAGCSRLGECLQVNSYEFTFEGSVYYDEYDEFQQFQPDLIIRVPITKAFMMYLIQWGGDDCVFFFPKITPGDRVILKELGLSPTEGCGWSR